jgi:hypothetical protein
MRYLIDMPEGWRPRSRPLECDLCPKHWACRKSFGVCPLANAKKAVEVTPDEMETYNEVNQIEPNHPSVHRINGKPVKLWATEEE